MLTMLRIAELGLEERLWRWLGRPDTSILCERPRPVLAAPCGGGDARPRGAQRRPKLRAFHGLDAEEGHAGVASLTVTSGL